MAIYVMSDIHGHYDEFLDFLDYVNFSEKDILYIIGDILNRGSNAIALIQDIMQRENIVFIKGNHELMLLPILRGLM